MAISEWVMADLVREVCFDVGDGPLLLGGALAGYRAFADALGTGARFPYMIAGVDDPAAWEAGSGTLDGEGRLVREPLASSAGGGAVSFAPGEKRIGLVLHSGWIAGLRDALAGKQDASAGLDALAEVAPTGFGRGLLEQADAAAARAALELGMAAVRTVGAEAGTVAAGDDARIIGALQRGGDHMTGPLILSEAPASNMQAATKAYVDAQIQAIGAKASARLATTGAISLAGLPTIDGVMVAAGDRILVKDQANAADNGIYVADTGAWSRAADMDGWGKIPGASIWVETGAANADRAWLCTANAGGTLGSSAIGWTQYGGPGAYQAVSANLTAMAGLASQADRIGYFTGSGTAALAVFTGFARSLVDDADAASARTTLGLGTVATQSAGNVAISGGSAILSALEISRVGAAATISYRISTDAGFTNGMQLQTGAAARWSVNKNGSAESGGNAGSDFEIRRFDDAGTYISTPLRIGRADGVVAIDSGLRPLADNGQALGLAGYRWSVIYAASGTINTSDARAKCDVGAVPEALLDAWGDVQWRQFRFVDAVAAKGADARWHVGLVAQAVRDAIDARMGEGAAVRLGLLCHDAWPAEAEERDGEGALIRPAREAGARWGLRYEECLALEAAWQRRRIDRIEALLSGGGDAGG
ncbi:tail fiber domain-containing protein [Sphingobium yanoikuyae]|uniref:tail fiber domain-containing protein n=1 Tax=Sphingobium yanoikuyae TaxID=13690 RepID=UPI0028AD0D25|nr:tail fiber domain-containing protein [Sphingobium yanoikuyae]